MKGLITALRTLTVLPVPGRDAEGISSSLPWFPAVGLALGFAMYGLALLGGYMNDGGWPQLTALVIVGAGAVVTGGIHLDGLADWADGLGGGRDKTRILEIMKDSSIGAFGVLALIFICAGKWIAIVKLIGSGAALWIPAAYIVSRTIQVDLIVSLPYARKEGGTAGAFVEGGKPLHMAIALVAAFAMMIFLYGSSGAGVVVIGWIAARIFGHRCRKRVGGVTGDLLGACSELVETGILLLGVAL